MRKRLYLILLFAFVTCSAVLAQSPWPDEESERDESVRKPVRRLHPERDRDKAIKEYLKEQERVNNVDEAESATNAKNKPDRRKVVKRVAQQQTSTVDQAFLDELMSRDYSLGPVVPLGVREPYKWIDEPVTVEERDLMAILTSESHGAAVRYMPRDVTAKLTDNAFYLYFDERLEPESLRLRLQYCADDPLNFSRIDFVIDGFDYTYTPSNTKRGKLSARLFWETCDDVVGQDDKDLIYALTHCKWAEMLLIGADGINHLKELTDDQLASLRAMLQLYLLRGGQL